MPEATQVFVDHRELLFSVVYTMLGSVADTEDVLQETWLAWAPRSGSGEEIANPRAYLVRIAVNRALARQESINRRREHYVGPWLPEPVATGDQQDASEQAIRAESVSMALLVVLQSLTPLERVVFLLNEVFGYAHTEIAGILDRTPASVRQLAHRAREHVQARRPRYDVDPRLRRKATEKFLAAVFGGDLGGLLRLLAPDVTLWSDGGGKAPQPGLRPVHGRDKVARLLTSGFDRVPAGLDIRYREVNGDPSAVLFDGDAPFGMMVLDLTPDGEQVSGIYTVTNPDKLTHLGQADPEGEPGHSAGEPSLRDVDD
ncbi:sigma-70 family RNA polymerase sigma factor [Nonomuraea phyllanthi]|uniref:RNA polymerase sigma factor SigJ n=1 Tax=Nonomuraea phyllanthi TaxID=2219224 RepID=UPI00129377B1|nr:RNA polymerase sigma factor SigJ [Nonomuraea phyllanthi]QFY10497.1 sigma-70 family RNA polymerase sigma factor [Nonomuraea phyllanthi]